ncbi:hypothetical protein PanWU01x14_206740 [Parasponia andersonii]|uniref:Uncharacterized protein n=1 Tax=Parasponia andersonii TaxID=3476 RepID=A0A2P5BVM9_PARAD|nr:hypothetical protein PanWU01x14_206740 [Parasponia andersonii]
MWCICFDSDCLNIVLAVNSETGLSTEDLFIGDIQSLLLNSQVDACCYVDRESNKVADTLEKLSFRNDFIFLSYNDTLSCIAHTVAADLS